MLRIVSAARHHNHHRIVQFAERTEHHKLGLRDIATAPNLVLCVVGITPERGILLLRRKFRPQADALDNTRILFQKTFNRYSFSIRIIHILPIQNFKGCYSSISISNFPPAVTSDVDIQRRSSVSPFSLTPFMRHAPGFVLGAWISNIRPE